MKKASALILFACFTAGACTQVVNNTDRAAINVKETAIAVRERVIDYFTYYPPQKYEPYVEPRYCYKAMQDIICYSEPIPGEETRLVGWQGSGAALAREAPASGGWRNVDASPQEAPPLEPIFVSDAPVATDEEPASKINLSPEQKQLY